MCDWEGPRPEFVKIIDVNNSRMLHKCIECGANILPGSKYRSIAGVWEGYFDRMSQCELCARIWQDLVDNGFCPDLGGLWEFIEEEFEEADDDEEED